MDGHSEKVLGEFVGEMRSRLLALKKARIAGSRLADIVHASLPQGQTFRDFLPVDVDRETASFKVFAERNLEGVVKLTGLRRGTDVLYEIVGSGQDIEPEPGDLWRAFVSIKPNLQLILDNRKSLHAVALDVIATNNRQTRISPVSLAEHRDVCDAYRQQLKQQRIEISQLDEILRDYTAASYTKWLKILRTHTPPLDREWGEFRKQAMLGIFRKRLQALGIGEADFAHIVDQFTDDAPRTSNTSARPVAANPEAALRAETTEDQVRRRLHLVIDRMTLEEMNALQIPFGLFFKTCSDQR